MNVNDYERPKQDFKETINIPIAIPAWGMLCLLGSLFYFGGSAIQKLNTVIENSAKTELQVADTVKQTTAAASDMKIMQIAVTDLKARVVVLELRRK